MYLYMFKNIHFMPPDYQIIREQFHKDKNDIFWLRVRVVGDKLNSSDLFVPYMLTRLAVFMLQF